MSSAIMNPAGMGGLDAGVGETPDTFRVDLTYAQFAGAASSGNEGALCF
jgi:hypothetical protein